MKLKCGNLKQELGPILTQIRIKSPAFIGKEHLPGETVRNVRWEAGALPLLKVCGQNG